MSSLIWIHWPSVGWFQAKKDGESNYVYTKKWIKSGSKTVETDSPDNGVIHDGNLRKVSSPKEAKREGDYVTKQPFKEGTGAPKKRKKVAQKKTVRKQKKVDLGDLNECEKAKTMLKKEIAKSLPDGLTISEVKFGEEGHALFLRISGQVGSQYMGFNPDPTYGGAIASLKMDPSEIIRKRLREIGFTTENLNRLDAIRLINPSISKFYIQSSGYPKKLDFRATIKVTDIKSNKIHKLCSIDPVLLGKVDNLMKQGKFEKVRGSKLRWEIDLSGREVKNYYDYGRGSEDSEDDGDDYFDDLAKALNQDAAGIVKTVFRQNRLQPDMVPKIFKFNSYLAGEGMPTEVTFTPKGMEILKKILK